MGIEAFREDSIQYGYPQSVTLEVFQSPFLDVSIVTCLLSVSYTHLDVYKRQFYGWQGVSVICLPLFVISNL